MKFRCQHGDMECACNMAQACMLKLVPEQKDLVPAIHCMMSNQPTLGKFVYYFLWGRGERAGDVHVVI